MAQVLPFRWHLDRVYVLYSTIWPRVQVVMGLDYTCTRQVVNSIGKSQFATFHVG